MKMLSDQNEKIQDTRRVMNETESIGNSVIESLLRQREQLEHANASMDRADSNLDDSSRLVNRIMRR